MTLQPRICEIKRPIHGDSVVFDTLSLNVIYIARSNINDVTVSDVYEKTQTYIRAIPRSELVRFGRPHGMGLCLLCCIRDQKLHLQWTCT
jgi:hypothetical protein